MRLPGPRAPKNWQNLHRIAKLGLAGRDRATARRGEEVWVGPSAPERSPTFAAVHRRASSPIHSRRVSTPERQQTFALRRSQVHDVMHERGSNHQEEYSL